MSKESVMAALRKAREGNIFGGTGQAEFNKIFTLAASPKQMVLVRPTVTSR